MLHQLRLQQVLQVLAALSLLLLPLLFFYGQNQRYNFNTIVLVKYIGFCLVFGGIYFFHSYFLFPKLYAEKKLLAYIACLIVILAVIVAIRPFDYFIAKSGNPPPPLQPHKFDHPPHRNEHGPKQGGPLIDIISVFIFFIIIILDVSKATNKQLRLTTERALKAEAEKAHAELSFLKAQVNPHFLFNILNNIYTLAVIKDENTAPSIMKLSNMMRYLTDQGGNDEVDLEEEITCMSDYIDLQRLRLTQKTNLIYEVTGDPSQKKIAPLILMAFVENVFKYGISNHKKNQLVIKLFIEQTFVNLYCENTINPEKKTEKRTGIGLENTKKRLGYLYPNRHILEVTNDQKVFKINLTIHLNS
ncbi:sensor histidine kinase [Nubsella zeaxanthinifaciens]|uniref:sensor histidine kinase n=1 Tax=Nubsella zeaxanthinifaciens TaxID=392412 RepID=UPI000DE45641|nr:sensor histidine kinase [Nubsella zeaxanthinifaciens]